MESIESLVVSARSGDLAAYGRLVDRFQDMAVGYAYSILHDFQLAEDAAQEAFWEAFRCLGRLRTPAAFPGWFRPIVFKNCDRISRRRQVPTVPLQESFADGPQTDPAQRLERREAKDRVLEAVATLPRRQRDAITLYYIGGYSCAEVGEFLGLPVGSVKKSLHLARHRLRDLLVDLVGDSLRSRRPSRDVGFAARVMDVLQASRRGDAGAIKGFLDRDPGLAGCRDSLGNSPVVLASNAGHEEVVQMLLARGAPVDFHDAAAIGATARVRELLDQDATLLDSFSAEGFTATALAAHFGHGGTLGFLLDRGADPNLVSRHSLGVTPLHAALFGRKPETAALLVSRGANVSTPRGGGGWPRAGWRPLHYAAALGDSGIVRLLLNAGADPRAPDATGRTPLEVAAEAGYKSIVQLLEGRLAVTPTQRR